MIPLRYLILATTALALTKLSAAPPNNYPPTTPPGGGSCKSSGSSGSGSSGSSAPTSQSLDWSIRVGLARYPKPTSLIEFSQTAFEKNGNLPDFNQLYSRVFTPDPLQQTQVILELAQTQLSAATFHPSCLFLQSESYVLVGSQPALNGAPEYINQILTDDAYTFIDLLPAPQSGWRLRVWKRDPAIAGLNIGLYTAKPQPPLNEVTFRRPTGITGDNTLIYTQKDTTGLAGTRTITSEIVQTLDASGKPLTVVNKQFVGADTTGALLSQENLTYSERGAKSWDYTIVRETLTAPVNAAGTVGVPVITAKTREDYDDYSTTTNGGEPGMKRLMTSTQAYSVAGQLPQTTTNTYIQAPTNSAMHGRLQSTLKPDGSWTYSDYVISVGSPVSITTEYSSCFSYTIAQRALARKTVTTVSGNESLVETFIGSQLVAKSRITLGSISGDPVTTSEKWDGTAWHVTTTAYHSDTTVAPATGRIKWIENSDGTAATYSYANPSGNLITTVRTGAGSRSGITAGTQTVTTSNLGNFAISQVTTNIASNLTTERWDTDLTYNSGFDALGRPIKRIYNADANDYDITQYACCGLEYSRDRMGMTSQYFRDGLKRVYKVETKASAASPVVTDFTTVGGLTQTRSRTIGGQSLFLSSSTRSLDGLTRTTTAPARKSTLVADRPVTTSVTSIGIGTMTETTTFADGSTTINTSDLSGRVTSIGGTAVPDKVSNYNTHTLNGGGEATFTQAIETNTLTYQANDLIARPIKFMSDTTGTTLYTYHSTTAAAGSRGKLATVTDGDGVTTSYGYDAEGQLTTTSRTIPLATGTATQVTTTTRDVVANVLLQGRNFGISRRQTQTLAATGLPTVTTSESFAATAGLVTGSRSFGRETLNVTTRPDAAGIATTTSTQPDGTKSLQIRTHGLVTAVQRLTTTGSIVTATSYGYDTLQRPITSTDARTGTTTFSALTESGQPLTTTSPGNLATTIACDVMGRKISTTLPDATVSYTSYYPTGLVRATWGSQTYPTWLVYNEQNMQTKLHTWKVAPVLTATTASPPAGSDVTAWSYGSRALLNRKQYADGKGTNYTYTVGGKLASRTWARGITTTYSYTQGLLTLTDYSDITPDVAITYDGYGRQSTVTQASQSRITYSYNPTNLTLASELVNYDHDRNGTYEFTRTLDRSRDSLLRDSGYSLKTANSTLETSAAYSYSATDGRISQISNPLIPNQLFNYSYLPSSDLLSTVSGPIHTVANTWEPNRDVLDIKQNKVGTSVISSYDYAVNAIGQRTGVTTSGTAFPAVPSWAWSYDTLGQVIAADSSVATSDRSYQYDTIGNRQKSANSLTLPVANNYSANLLNQYSAINNQQSSVINPSYDFDGNATAYPMPVAPTTNSTLTWDAENRLISSTVGTAITTYQYDAQSRRIAKVAGTSATTSTATLYLYDAWNCLAEYERGTGVSPVLTLKKTRLWGTDLSGTPQGAGGVSGLLSESLISNPQSPIYYPTYDGNGNISEYLTATGTTAAHFEYDPFGNTVVNTDTANLFTYRFSTKPRDQETGLYYYGYRYYDPMSGRWPSRDPIEEKGGSNLYGFVGNSSIGCIDLLGLSPEPPDCCKTEDKDLQEANKALKEAIQDAKQAGKEARTANTALGIGLAAMLAAETAWLWAIGASFATEGIATPAVLAASAAFASAMAAAVVLQEELDNAVENFNTLTGRARERRETAKEKEKALEECKKKMK
jgi:RHS repeat-associated protein